MTFELVAEAEVEPRPFLDQIASGMCSGQGIYSLTDKAPWDDLPDPTKLYWRHWARVALMSVPSVAEFEVWRAKQDDPTQ